MDWEVCRKGDPVLLMGDMNAVPHSWAYRTLLKSGLEDQRAGTGVWGGSWPMGGGFVPFPFFRLDHVFSSGVELGGVLPVTLPDSDHIGLRVWLESSSADR